MKHLQFSLLAFAAVLLATAAACRGEDLPGPRQAGALKVAYVLDNQMVLQRGMKTPIWGRNTPGTTVTVALDGQQASAKTGADGKWIVRLDPMKANAKSQDLTISDGVNTVTIQDVLIGDVWLLSGQSNMETKTGILMAYGRDTRDPITGPMVERMVDYCNENIFKGLDETRLRYIQVPRCTGMAPQDDFDRAMETGVWGNPAPVKRKWVTARSDENGGAVQTFSALGFAFAYELLKKTNVPIGLIDTSKGGTLVSSWMEPQVAYASCDFGKKRVMSALLRVKAWQELMAVRDDEAEYTAFLKEADAQRAAYLEYMNTPAVLKFLEEKKDDKNVKSFVKALAAFKAAYAEYMKTPFAQRVKDRAAGPFGPNIAGRSMAGLTPPKGQPRVRNAYVIPKDPAPSGPEGRDQTGYPGAMYYGTLTPVMPMGLTGVVWFQGENNHFAGKGDVATQYHLMQGAMIRSWRMAWGQGDFAFYTVQLPNTPGPFIKEATEGSGWVFIADAQRKTLEVPNTGLGVCCDIGGDLHWQNKYDLGWRLALIVRAELFGEKIECYGPLYKSHVIKGDKILVTFDHVGSGLAAGIKTDVGPATRTKKLLPHHQFGGGDLQYFQIADETTDAAGKHAWHWATAKIISKDTVEVSSPEVKNPKAVRYMWHKFAQVPNFYNSEGLPAAVFRTDDWEWPEGWDRRTVGEEIEQLRATCEEKGILPAYAR